METGSKNPIRQVGLGKYLDCPDLAIHCVCFSFSDEPDDHIHVWQPHVIEFMQHRPRECALDLTNPAQAKLFHWLSNPEVLLRAFNAEFELAVMLKLYRMGLVPYIATNRWRCTAMEFRAVGIRGGLDGIAKQYGYEGKHAAGKQLIKDTQYIDGYGYSKVAFVIQDLIEYCKNDVISEKQIVESATRLDPWELKVWHKHLEMNTRGVKVDIKMAKSAMKLKAKAADNANAALKKITGKSMTLSQSVKLREWVNSRPAMVGRQTKSVDKEALPKIKMFAIEFGDKELEAFCTLKLENPEASVAKYAAALRAVCNDGYLRNMFVYQGAHTRRWTSVIVQLQNLNQGLSGDPDLEQVCKEITELDQFALQARGPLMSVLGKSVRYMIRAPNGYVIVIWDYSQIEARTLSWLANSKSRMDFFTMTDNDPDTKVDIYKYTYGKMFKVDAETVTKQQRAVGKVCELLLGYAGGAPSIVKFAMKTGHDLLLNYESSRKAYPGVADSLDWCWDTYGSKSGLPKILWYAAELYKKIWRNANPEITQLWDIVNDAVRFCCTTKQDYTMQLAGGRYPVHLRWINNKEDLQFVTNFSQGQVYRKMRIAGGSICYQDVLTRQTNRTYGGDLVQTINQGLARDIMAQGWLRLPQWIKCVGTVHDELFAYVKKDKAQEALEVGDRLLSQPYLQCPGLSVKSEGEITTRYKK